MPIGSLVNTTPGAGDVAGTSGPAELKDIKTQIRASFPAFTTGNDVVTKTAGQINNAPDKTAVETITGGWNFTGSYQTINGQQIATQLFANTAATATAVGVVSTTLAAASAPTGVWNFVNGLQVGGNAVATQAFLAASRGHGKMSLALSSVAGTGSPVTQTGTTGAVLSNVTHTTGSGTLTVTNSGVYRLKLIFRAASWSGTPGNAGVKVRLNGSSDLVEFVFTVLSGELNMIRSLEDFVSLSAGDNLQMQLNIPVGLTLTTGSIALLVERMT
jgi:hypothetical protein